MPVTQQQRTAFDPAETIRLYAGISRKSQALLKSTLHRKLRHAGTRAPQAVGDEFGIQRAFYDAWLKMAGKPLRP